jgi:hypothetical protein
MSKRNSDWYVPPDWLALFALCFVLPCTALLASMLLPIVAQLKTADLRALYGFGLGTGETSTVLLFIAQLPLYKQRRFWTIGPTNLDRRHRRIYWLAYIFLAASLLLLGIVWLRAHEN